MTNYYWMVQKKVSLFDILEVPLIMIFFTKVCSYNLLQPADKAAINDMKFKKIMKYLSALIADS